MQSKRSIFGPLVLIAAGVIWLLIKSGTVPAGNLWALTHVWPFLLIAAGIGIILRPYWSYTSIVLDVLIVGGLVLSILYAPALKWDNPSMFSMMSDGDVYIGPGEAGSGKVITKTADVANFHAIEVNYPAEVFIRQGDKASVKIEAEDNLMPNLRTEVKNGRLSIFYKKTNNKHVNPTERVIITITVKELDQVTFASAGEITVEGISSDNLEAMLTGAGNLELKNVEIKNLTVSLSGAGGMTASGTTGDLEVNISGFGEFDGSELQGKSVKVTISGAGTATVWADADLDAEISGGGSIHYYGSPTVTKEINGIGAVDPLGEK